MLRALRPYVTAGVAVIGTGLIGVTSVVAPAVEQQISQPAVTSADIDLVTQASSMVTDPLAELVKVGIGPSPTPYFPDLPAFLKDAYQYETSVMEYDAREFDVLLSEEESLWAGLAGIGKAKVIGVSDSAEVTKSAYPGENLLQVYEKSFDDVLRYDKIVVLHDFEAFEQLVKEEDQLLTGGVEPATKETLSAEASPDRLASLVRLAEESFRYTSEYQTRVMEYDARAFDGLVSEEEKLLAGGNWLDVYTKSTTDVLQEQKDIARYDSEQFALLLKEEDQLLTGGATKVKELTTAPNTNEALSAIIAREKMEPIWSRLLDADKAGLADADKMLAEVGSTQSALLDAAAHAGDLAGAHAAELLTALCANATDFAGSAAAAIAGAF